MINRRGFLAHLAALPVAWRLRQIPAILGPPRPKWLNERVALAMILQGIQGSLPRGIEIYDIAGQTVFPVYGATGMICTSSCAYFVDHQNSLASCVQATYADTQAIINKKIVWALSHFKPTNLDGGLLPETDYIA